MSKKIQNYGDKHLSFPVVNRKIVFNNQVSVEPGGKASLDEAQMASEAVEALVGEGKLSKVDGGVVNETAVHQSFPTDGKSVEVRRQVSVPPNGSATVSDDEAKSPSVKRLVNEGDIECEDAPEDVPAGKDYSVTLDKESYIASGSNVVSIKATVTPDDEDLSAEDKEGWEADSKSNRLDFTGVTFSSNGIGTFKLKRNDGASLKSFTDTVTIKKDGATFATATVVASPYIYVTTDSTDKMLTDGVEKVTSIKINSVSVKQSDYEVKSLDKSIATVKLVGDAYEITPLAAGKATFSISDKTGSAEFSITFVEPACVLNGVYYKTLAAAFKVAQNGETVALASDVTESVTWSGQTPRQQGFFLTVDLAGHTWTAPATASYALRAEYGTLTLVDSVGTGKVLRGKDYAFIVSHLAGDYEANFVIDVPNTVEFTGQSSVLQNGTTGGVKGKATYNYYGGAVTIKGGTFITTADPSSTNDIDSEGMFGYTLNMLDMTAANGYGAVEGNPLYPSSISVEGGRFKMFDPSNCRAEGPGTSFLAAGFKSVRDGDYFEVSAV